MPERTLVKDKWAAVQKWKQHQWAVGKACRELGVKLPKLLVWKAAYWDASELTEREGERYRARCAGRPHRLAPYELDVLRYYDGLLENSDVNKNDIMFYCNTFPEFGNLKSRTQQSWVRRFMERYKRHPDVVRPSEEEVE
ncbi:unnamed protein product [Phytophthora fragariaefolia]|uniref:Unnamed protein product n=1 Tax=Phytophthora fragariaefolia TaxID=1490495 RepID=A0A9W7CZU5_9STRA|nr:unnamed protein product [Phytophthora fragariaefolia]